MSDDWDYGFGGQRADANVKAGPAYPELGQIPVIDLESASGDTTVTSFWANVLWQAPARWSLGFSYFLAEANVQKVTDEDIGFGILDIPAGTGVGVDFTTDFYLLQGYYDFYQASDQAAGIGLGLRKH